MKKILIVDDNDLNITILEGILEKKYKVYIATNGFNAMQMINDDSFDVIILDIQMPDMDGIEVCRKIKDMEERAHIPILFISAAANDKTLRKSVFDAGATDFINKPFKSEYVLQRIENILINQI